MSSRGAADGGARRMSATRDSDRAFWVAHQYASDSGGAIEPDTAMQGHDPALALAGHVVAVNRLYLDQHRFQPRIARCQTWLLPASPRINARAIQHGARRAVFLHGGLLRSLWNALHMLLAGSCFLADRFGWQAADLSPPPPAPGGVRLFPQVTGGDGTDPLSYLKEVYGRAVEFVYFHEIAHHGRDHIARLRVVGGQGFVDEGLAMAAGAGTVADLLRLLEFDADLNAVDMCLNATGFATWAEGETPRFADPDYMTSELFLHLTGMVTLFMLLDRAAPNAPAQYDGGHPPALHRAIRLSVGLADTVQAATGLSRAQVDPFLDHAWSEVVSLAGRLGYPPGLWTGRQDQIARIGLLDDIADRANALSREIDAELGQKPAARGPA
ncbi:hypothetical protein MB818_13920 [Ruegeria sp. 1NDH52C]|uniref:HEXXH motif-containing protein n=1 Tax=Ruegeria alba TaxID=2916756 RepID=A0ABS9NYK2_9RHOB|nr:hypothetical protein [Ruegeria alba]MCG6559308.1 hypothetical protein [Ruegeria alba]